MSISISCPVILTIVIGTFYHKGLGWCGDLLYPFSYHHSSLAMKQELDHAFYGPAMLYLPPEYTNLFVCRSFLFCYNGGGSYCSTLYFFEFSYSFYVCVCISFCDNKQFGLVKLCVFIPPNEDFFYILLVKFCCT